MNARERKSEAGDTLRAEQPNGSYAIGGTSGPQGIARLPAISRREPWATAMPLRMKWPPEKRTSARTLLRSAGRSLREEKEYPAGAVSSRPSRQAAKKGPGISARPSATASNEVAESFGAEWYSPRPPRLQTALIAKDDLDR